MESDLELAIEKILDGQAVLFAGAGFSFGAKNHTGKVPSAKDLKKKLLTDVKMDENLEYNLETIANYYIKVKSESELINLLKEQYEILSVADYHTKLLGIDWKRIYTTNYDQVIEKASKNNSSEYWKEAVILSDDFENSEKKSICVHINGYIERLNKDSLSDEFKLTDKSYSCDTLVGNPWFEFMNNDLEAASVIVVIGYSMQFDIDIKRLLSSPEISKKVIFIDSPQIDEISKNLLESYGTCYPIGIENFCEKIEEIKADYVPKMELIYKSFKLNYHNTINSINPTYEEIVRFYTEGKSCDKLFNKNKFGDYNYILNRKAMDYFITCYQDIKVFIAISNLGNGKTIFLNMIEKEFQKKDIKVYTYIHRYDSIDEEIEQICNEQKRCIVILDNYPGHLDILKRFSEFGHSNITFLLSARNGVNLMFCKQLERALNIKPDNIKPLYLNTLQDSEIKDLVEILENNSLLSEKVNQKNSEGLYNFIKTDCKSMFSALLLQLFESSNIKQKLINLYKDMETLENEKIKEVVIFSLLKNTSNYDLKFNEILDLFNADYVLLKKNNIEFIDEIFKNDSDSEINVRSSVISLFLIKNVIYMNDIINTMKKAFFAADCKNGQIYTELQKSMVSHSQFIFISKDSDKEENLSLIESFYNDIRNTKFAKHNTFFWEQFASAYIDMKKFDMVKKCIDTAFVEANKRNNFVPFQVKTVQGRYYVEKCYYDLLNERCNKSEAIEAIVNATNSILEYYSNPENNLYYVFKVVKRFSDIYERICELLDKREILMYIERASIMNKKMLDFLSKDAYSQYHSKVSAWQEKLSETIDNAKKILKDKWSEK